MRRDGGSGVRRLSAAFLLVALARTCGAVEFSRWHHYSLDSRPAPSIGRGRSYSADQITRRPTWDNGMRFRAAASSAAEPDPDAKEAAEQATAAKLQPKTDALKSELSGALAAGLKAENDEASKQISDRATGEEKGDLTKMQDAGAGAGEGGAGGAAEGGAEAKKAEARENARAVQSAPKTVDEAAAAGASAKVQKEAKAEAAIRSNEQARAEGANGLSGQFVPGSPEQEAQMIAAIKRQPPPGAPGDVPEAPPKAPAKPRMTAAKMRAIEMEITDAIGGLMTGYVANVLTQNPNVVRRARSKAGSTKVGL